MYWPLAGEPAAINAARRLVNELEGIALVIPPHARPLYHAAAVVASNYLIAVLAFAVRLMMQVCGALSRSRQARVNSPPCASSTLTTRSNTLCTKPRSRCSRAARSKAASMDSARN